MKHPLTISTITILLLAACSTNNKREEVFKHDILWYDSPAENWNEALPLGNGRIGVMVFGDPHHERIQLNDDSMWPADPGWDEPEGTPEDLQEIRELLFEDDHVEADRLFVEKFSNKSILRSHQTVGDLFIDLEHGEISNYRRELDLSTATATITYRSDGALVTEKAFVSHPHQLIIITLETESEQGLNGRIWMDRPMDNSFFTPRRTTEGNMLAMKGEITQANAKFRSITSPIDHSSDNVEFMTLLKLRNKDGDIINRDGHYEFRKVKKLTILISNCTSTYREDYKSFDHEMLDAVNGNEVEELWEEHVHDHQSLYSRVELDLGGASPDSLPTDRRLALVRDGNIDAGLEALLFHYGRYLLIASSRPGSYPANLQGLWNEHIEAPWNADYHLNINLQMNYWPANLTNLHELNMPLFDLIDRLVENGRVTALKTFGCRGSFIPHATDLWAPTWLRAPTAYWGCSVGAGGWLMQHYWQHFKFTCDTAFLLERAFPAMYEVAQFYSDWIIEDPRDGSLISAPSTSPENRFFDDDGNTVATCLGSAMDQQVIAEVFDNYLEACNILGIDNDLRKNIMQQRQKLRPGFVIGSDGRILEWDREYKEPEPGHRHMSHLYGFHPGTAITKIKTPDIYKAVRKTLEHRLEHGGAGTGWSRAWLINCSARLQDGNMAHEHIQLLLQRSMFDNLFDAHPPFQIDGNFGYTAGVAEMLVQSHEDGKIRLLPALPEAWADGSVKGLNARGGYEISMEWADGKLAHLTLFSKYGGKIKLLSGNKDLEIHTDAGKSIKINW